MSDVETAFKILDFIQGHPGYASVCAWCGQALTNYFGMFVTQLPVRIEAGVAYHETCG